MRWSQPDDWCRHSDLKALLDDLIATATGAARQMTSVRGLSLFGTGATTSEVRDKPEKPDEKNTHLIIMPSTAPKPPPSLDELANVIKGHRRKGCLFHVVLAVGEVSPNAGRIGGLPWMPRDSRWPCKPNGEPLEFVGQLPLDAAREAGLLPFDVPPGSLLTVFSACDDWDNAGSTREGALSIHGTEDLIELNPPEADYETIPLCAIRAEIRDLYPSLTVALEIIDWELDHPDLRPLGDLTDEYEQQFPNPNDVTRVGGYPFWIQNADDGISFVAQICSDGVSDLNFGDAGSLYIHGDSADNLSAFIQCY